MDEPEFLRNLQPGVPFLMTNVSWERYLDLCEQMTHRRLRTTYCYNEFEILPASFEHELRLCMIDRLFNVITEKFRISRLSTGSATCRRPDLQIAMEPERSYYLINQKFINWREEVDLRTTPPPELVVEVDIPYRSANGMRVLAGLGVPEVWRYDGHKLRVFLLLGNGEYIEAERSSCCPPLPISAIERFLLLQNELDDTTIVLQFCAWLEEQVITNSFGGGA